MRSNLFYCLLFILTACGGGGGGGSGNSDSTPSTSSQLTVVSSSAEVVVGGNKVSLTATRQTISDPVRWSLAAGSPGTLDATSGDSVNYLPPPIGSISADTPVTVVATAGSVSRNTSISLLKSGMFLVAGNIGGSGSLNGRGNTARFNGPVGMTIDAAGNLYVADVGNRLIRKITPDRVVTTLAGLVGATGVGADGPPNVARFVSPTDVAIDQAGNLYVCDNLTIRKVTPGGNVNVLNVSGAKLGLTGGIAVDATGNLYVTNQAAENNILKISPSGIATVFAPSLVGSAIAIDTTGNLYVTGVRVVWKINPAGVVSILAGNPDEPGANDGTGTAARFSGPKGITADAAGNIYVADSFNQAIRKITSAGVVTTLAGSLGIAGNVDGNNTAARFNFPSDIVQDSTGNFYVADGSNNTIRKITPAGVVTTLAGEGIPDNPQFSSLSGIAADAAGNLFIADNDPASKAIRKISPQGTVSFLAGSPGNSSIDGIGSAAQFASLRGITVDPAGNLYVVDRDAERIRKISSNGAVTTLTLTPEITRNADGTLAIASIKSPIDLTLDPAGNLYVLNYFDSRLPRIQVFTVSKITPEGTLSTFAGNPALAGYQDGVGTAAQFFMPVGITADSSGNLYVTERSAIRKITPTGVVSTVAGDHLEQGRIDSVGAAARFQQLGSITTDPAGNLYVTDVETIRKITPAGVVSTLAGTPLEVGIRLGSLPGSLNPGALTYVSPNTLAVTTEHSVIKIVLP